MIVKIYLNIWTPLQTTTQYFTICDCEHKLPGLITICIGWWKLQPWLALKIECNVAINDILISYLFFSISFASRYEILLNSVQFSLQYNLNKQILRAHAFVEKCHTDSDSSFLSTLRRDGDENLVSTIVPASFYFLKVKKSKI